MLNIQYPRPFEHFLILSVILCVFSANFAVKGINALMLEYPISKAHQTISYSSVALCVFFTHSVVKRNKKKLYGVNIHYPN